MATPSRMKEAASALDRNSPEAGPSISSNTDTPGAFGLLELAHGENTIVDIVALHGLDGHRETSWTADNGIFWLRDLLPTRIPNARIFSYGYDVNTQGQEQLSTASLHDQGINLIAHLALKRKMTFTEERPIIFVAHSLGGIILKSALIYANACGKSHLPDHKAIEVSTFGILFFATPHQGSETANLASVMLDVLTAFGRGTPEIVKDLQSNSRMLQEQLTHYQAISSRFNTKFYVESKKTPIGPDRILLVPRYSAVVPGAVNTEAVHLNKNHIDIVKFQSAADDDFSLVSSHLLIMAEEATQRIVDRWEFQRRAEWAIPQETGMVPGASQIKTDQWKSRKTVEALPRELAPLPLLPYQEAGESFVGRSQALDWIHEMFKKHRKLVLYGIGGIGKTGTAVEYVYTHRQDYDIIFWVNGDTSESTTSGFVGIAQQLVKWKSQDSAPTSPGPGRNYLQELGLGGCVDDRGKVSDKMEDRMHIQNTVKSWLSRSKSGSWLLIFDNVDDLESFDLTTFFPTPVVGQILITSRKLESCSLGEASYEVTALGEEDSIQLLVNKSHVGEADSAAREIVRMLEGLPLAIELAAAHIAALQLSYNSYLKINQEPWKSIFRRSIKPYGKSLITTWEVSYRTIAARSPTAAKILSICAFLSNEDIPEWLFREKLGDAALDEALEQIFAFSLAKRVPATSSFSMHPLVHAWARERLDEENKTATVTDMVILLSDTVSQPHVSWAHVSTCARHALQHCLPKLNAKSEISIFQSLEKIAEREKGKLLQGMFLFALEATQSVEGPNSVQTFIAMSRLGGAYCGITGLRAGEFLQKALQYEKHGIELFILGPNLQGRLDEWIQSSQQGVGINSLKLTEQAHWKEAEGLFHRSVEGLGEILGLDHPETVWSVNNLANTLHNLGRFEEAEKMFRHVFESRERTLGLDHPDTLSSVSNLANILFNFGRFEEAEKIHRRAFESYERTLGLDHPNTLDSVSNTAILLRNLGRFEEAETMHRHAFESCERTLGLDHPNTLWSVVCLAYTLAELGRFEEAEKMHRHAFESYERTLGLDHLDTLWSVDGLANTLRKLGRFAEAEKMHQRVLRGRERNLGLEHPHTLQSICNLAQSLSGLGRFEEAEKMGRRAVEGYKRNLGLDHPDTLWSLNNLALSWNRLGRFAEAENMHRRALEGRERTLGLYHPNTLWTLSDLAISLQCLGQLEEALAIHRRALEGYERTLGLDHPNTLRTVHNLAISLGCLGWFDKAEQMFQRALKGRVQILGLDHPDTLSTTHFLGFLLYSQDQFGEAVGMYQSALEGRKKALGSNHTHTLSSAACLVISLRKLGRFEEAETLSQSAFKGTSGDFSLLPPWRWPIHTWI